MSRKLLSLGYIYEIQGKHTEAIACFERVLESDSKKLDATIINEARLGKRANQMALKICDNKELITNGMNMSLMEHRIAEFRKNPQNLTGWFSQWN